MRAKRYRSKSYKQQFVRTPGSRTARHYKEEHAGVAKCASCGRPMGGVPRIRASWLRSLPRSSRMPNRPFGGYLCPACARQTIKMKVRV